MKQIHPQKFYDEQYQGAQYAAYDSAKTHPFYRELKSLMERYGSSSSRWLEVGCCGRGLLQDVVEDYTGVDLARTVQPFFHKNFVCSAAEKLPFDENSFDGCWSYAVLEHVDQPEQALDQMRRVLKNGGLLFLAPAWQCRSWAGQNYAWKSFSNLSLMDRIRKGLIPLRDAMGYL